MAKFMLMAASLRKDSVNKKLLTLAAKKVQAQGDVAEVKDFADYDLPSYNADVQAQGLPKAAQQLIHDLNEFDGLIFAVPEYNFSMPGNFKNLFDWVSRAKPMPWTGKKILFLSASPSLVGGNRGLWHTRVPFEACGAFVFPDMFSLANAYNSFDPHGGLIDKGLDERLAGLLVQFRDFVAKL